MNLLYFTSWSLLSIKYDVMSSNDESNKKYGNDKFFNIQIYLSTINEIEKRIRSLKQNDILKMPKDDCEKKW